MIDLNYWIRQIIFFNVPFKRDKEYVRKYYYNAGQHFNDMIFMSSKGWGQVYFNIDFMGNFIVWYEHDKFY